MAPTDNGDEKGYENNYNELVSTGQSRELVVVGGFVFLDGQVHRGSAGVARRGWVTLGSVATTARGASRRHLSVRLRRTSVGCVPRFHRNTWHTSFVARVNFARRYPGDKSVNRQHESKLSCVVIRVTTTISAGTLTFTPRGNERGENHFWYRFESWCLFFIHVLWYFVDFYEKAHHQNVKSGYARLWKVTDLNDVRIL